MLDLMIRIQRKSRKKAGPPGTKTRSEGRRKGKKEALLSFKKKAKQSALKRTATCPRERHERGGRGEKRRGGKFSIAPWRPRPAERRSSTKAAVSRRSAAPRAEEREGKGRSISLKGNKKRGSTRKIQPSWMG